MYVFIILFKENIVRKNILIVFKLQVLMFFYCCYCFGYFVDVVVISVIVWVLQIF